MTEFERYTLLLSAIAILVIPALVLLWRISAKVARTDDSLAVAVRDLDALVRDKDKIHTEMLAQMREDRAATDVRLRWLEKNMWALGRNGGSS